jgi:hypothetical protein
MSKLPKKDAELHARIEAAYWDALDEATSAADGETRLRRLVADLERQYLSAVACLAEDLPALCVHLEYPLRLRKRLRSTNLLERSLEEVKRRTKVIWPVPWRDQLPEPVLGGARPFHRELSRAGLTALSTDSWPRCAPPAWRRRRRRRPHKMSLTARLRPHFPAIAGRDRGEGQDALAAFRYRGRTRAREAPGIRSLPDDPGECGC